MKEVCTSSLLLLFMDILTLVQLVSPDNNYCLFNPVKGLSGNAVHACKDNTTSGSIVAMDISHFDGSDCFCQLRYTGEIDNHTTVEVYYRTPDENLSHRIELFAVNRNNDTEGLNQTTKTLQVLSGGPTNITVRSKSTRSLREGKLCVRFKLENDSYNLTLTCFNATYSEQDLGMKTENPNVVKPQTTQIATTLLQTTHRRTSTTSAIPTTHTTTTTVVQRSTSTITTSQKINKKTSLGATTTVISSSNTVSTQRVKQTSDVTVKNSATIEYIVNSEENDNPTAAIQAGGVTIIIIVGVSAVVCIVAVVLVVCCLKRRRRQMSRATVSQQSTHQNDEHYEITENAMYIPYIPTNDRNADCDNIYEEADIDTNQSGKEAKSLLQVHEVSRNVDSIDNTLK